MQILSVTLKNFKSHRDRVFEFHPGFNAICGENGAGKTSILEAIAWALFDYVGNYKKEDLICNGAASAQVRVAFVSEHDHRAYEVSRCTKSGYVIYDPQLNQRLALTRIKEEVMPWLREHLGVARETDLGKLFAGTIGVPQGTFTADFLLAKEQRKRVFDTILNVDEYPKTADALKELEAHARAQAQALENDIVHYDSELQNLVPTQQKAQEQAQAIARTQRTLQEKAAAQADLTQQIEHLQTQAAQVQQFETILQQLDAQIQTQQSWLTQNQEILQQAQQAVDRCTRHRDAYQSYLKVEAELQELRSQQRSERALQLQKQEQEKHLSGHQTRLATLLAQWERLTTAASEIEQLQPLIQTQTDLERQQQQLNQQLQTRRDQQQAVSHQAMHLTQTRTRLSQLEQEIAQLRCLEASVQRLPELERRQQRCQQQLSYLAAAAQFEADLQCMLQQAQQTADRHQTNVDRAIATLTDLQQSLPLWAESLASIATTLEQGKQGQQWTISQLQTILADLTQQTDITQLQHQLHQVEADIQQARQHQLALAALDRLMQEQEDLVAKITELAAQVQAGEALLAATVDLPEQLAAVIKDLAALNDPRSQCRLRQQELQNQLTLQQQIQKLEQEVAVQNQAIADLEAKLLPFATLHQEIQQQEALLNQHRTAYEDYLKHRELANTYKSRQQQVTDATEQLQLLHEQRQQQQQQHDRYAQSFDAQQLQALQETHRQLDETCITLRARLPEMERYQEELTQQLEHLQNTQAKRIQAATQLQQRKRQEDFITFARKAYKEAGPRITAFYIQSISQEADRLFRELLNRPNVSLEWGADYDILVRESSHLRRFVNLSGGEQMCAALSVRLALLKVLANINIAFFDEPTTNMDKPRRRQLAEAIANLKSFRQLFVISHDDTFEQVTENIIQVLREPF